MSSSEIQTYDFNEVKQGIEKFSKSIPSSVDLPTVATEGGLFGWFDHKVNGEELNAVTSQIQNLFINTNSILLSAIREFGEVYKALEGLDKVYIQGIIIGIKAAEKASEQAKEAASEALINSHDIRKTMEVLKKTIGVLENFKTKIDDYNHLSDIDIIWDATENLKQEILSIQKTVDDNEKKNYNEMKSIQISFNEGSAKIDEALKVLKTSICECDKKINETITSVQTEIRENIAKTNIEVAFVKNSTQETSNNIAVIKDDLLGYRAEFEKKAIHQDEYLEKLSKTIDNQKEECVQLLKKVKVSYLLAGTSMGAIIIYILLNIFGVI